MASLATADPAVQTEEGDEYLMCARYGECDDMIAFVNWGVPVDYVNQSKSTALHYACANGHIDCVKALVTNLNAKHLPNLSNNYPLHWAVEHKHKEVIAFLCGVDGQYVDVLAKNGFGKSALTAGFVTEDADIIKLLLEHSSADALEKSRSTNNSEKKPKLKPKLKPILKPKVKTKDVNHLSETKKTTNDSNSDSNASTATKTTTTTIATTPTATTPSTTTPSTTTPSTTISSETKLGQQKEQKDSSTAEMEIAVPPAERQVKQRVIHVFDMVPTKSEGIPPTLVRVQEMAIDWEGAAFTDDDDASKDVTGLYVWAASVVLSRWLVSDATILESMKNKTICELGAGAGLPGLTVAAHTKANSVLLTDLFKHTVKNMKDNIAMNRIAISESGVIVNAQTLDWCNTSQWPSKKLDIIIGSDLVYSKTMVMSLVSIIVGILDKNGIFYYAASTTERDGMSEFVQLMKSSGFSLELEMMAPNEYHSNPLYQATQTKCDRHFIGLKKKKFKLYKWKKTIC